MSGIEHTEIGVGDRVNREPRQYADSQPRSDVGLDDIRVVRRQGYVRAESRRLEQGLKRGATGETKGISDDRMFRELLEGQFAGGGERMSFRHDDCAMPPIERQA